MASRLWIKLTLKRCSMVAFLSVFTLSVVMIYTLPPFPSDLSEMHLLGPRNNKPSKMVGRHSLRPVPLHRRTRSDPEMKDSTKRLLMVNHQQLSFSVEEIVYLSAKKPLRLRKHQRLSHDINKHSFSAKRGQAVDAVNSGEPTIHLLRSRHNPSLPQSASMQSLHPKNTTRRHKCAPDGAKAKKLGGNFTHKQQVLKLKQAPEKKRTHERLSEPHSGAGNKGGASMRESTEWCETVPDESAVEDWNQTKTESLPWLSEDDVKKMRLLSSGAVMSKDRLSGHGQVLRVGLNDTNDIFAPAGADHIKRCQTGSCALIKRPSDWFEVFAFHLDRVLGLNRSLPAVLRTFHSDILPYRYTNGSPRPVLWWDPNIQHMPDAENDQNSFALTWPQYQTLLQSRCGSQVPLNFTNCVGVHNSEWGRLALFDFLLQVNDRLDRYCCGFKPDPSELCVENLLHVKCGNPKDLNLVHILVRKTDPSRLVFIDNAGRPYQAQDNLNFRLVEGVDEFPERAVSVLLSGCLEKMLLQSLSLDREFWVSRGGLSGFKPLIHQVEQRAKALLQHIRENKLRLNRDL
ncbi:Golgi-associated kinase 1A isoform X1 [Triplophysa dalaica]|uniref:Golgi-associated kinase 1A isoform X1 n=1 Tax=Triplophysa dalaica TaxID=1582913 RepID=UPI0024DF4171|nr:Golgi-associated kinase 1A isoform X1 [Triplophysa dalaica]